MKTRGVRFTPQVEVRGKDELEFVRAHIDFVVDSRREIVVVECKSISSAIEAPYESWVLQTQLQMGLLQRDEARPVRGLIIAINIADGTVSEFHIERNEALWHIATAKAKHLWAALQHGIEPEGQCGDLCAYCPFTGRCATLRSGAQTELPPELTQKITRLKELNAVEKEAKSIKDELKSFLENANLKKATAGDHTVSIVFNKGRESFDSEKLKRLSPDLYEECVRKGDGYSYLRVA